MRQDQVKLVFTAVQKGKVTATAPAQLGEIAGFVVKFNAHKSEVFQQGPFFYCHKETHDSNASCGGEPAHRCSAYSVEQNSACGLILEEEDASQSLTLCP